MIFRLIKLFSGGVAPSPSRRETAMPDEIDEKIAGLPPVPRKFREDIAILDNIFGEKFTTGLSISYSLQEILSILPRERKRVDSYAALTKYLHSERGITLAIKSNKTK
ncbi:MAG: hypothetical protein SNF93_07200 [Rikenellaceae bacterium]